MHNRVFSDPPAIIGHRGFGRNAEGRPRENTVESIRTAVEAGVDWIEIDVRRTVDDELVLLHDPAWPDGTLVAEKTAAELGPIGIATLDEALAALPATVGVDIEIKPSAEDALVSLDRSPAALLCPVLEREHGARPLLVSSFDPVSIGVIRDRVPQVPLGYITWLNFPFDIAVAAAKHLDAQLLMAHTGTYQPPQLNSRRHPEDIIEMAHKAGLELGVWSPKPATLDRFVAAGVDAITVDDVPGSVAALRDDA